MGDSKQKRSVDLNKPEKDVPVVQPEKSLKYKIIKQALFVYFTMNLVSCEHACFLYNFSAMFTD